MENSRIAAFLGIPFARPPTGALRWAPPQPAAEAEHFQADSFAPACMQGDHLVRWYRNLISGFGGDPDSFDSPSVGEDCLYLNIWTPQPEAAGSLPVMVWIHGGSNKSGWSYEPNYHGEKLAGRGVVVVSIAYRLGVFGFFPHPELEMSNFGLLDQMEALRWIKRNIRFFGGDPDNVTVFGESAGADDIGSLIVSPMSRGLFHRAVHQSGGSGVLITASKADVAALGSALGTKLGQNGSLAALRSTSADEVLAATDSVFADYYFEPLIDGHSLLEPPLASLARADIAPIDLVIGSNKNEWLMYLDGSSGDAGLAQWLADNGNGNTTLLLAMAGEQRAPLNALDRLASANDFACPSLALADAVNRAGGRARAYYFSRQRDGERGESMGAYHGAEIPYIFDSHDSWLPTNSSDRELTETMGRFWTEFAGSGVPHAEWPVFSLDDFEVQQFDSPSRIVRHPDADLCAILMPQVAWSDSE
ncbi:MAG: carboxylesterase family protein [Gammaproteobacteria bacterium]|nr:carboxylesterase family protein [Gammaproteobacteria bacterium]